jgi:hypothetical protein
MIQSTFSFSNNPDPLKTARIRSLSIIPLNREQTDEVFGGREIDYLEGDSAVQAYRRYQKIFEKHKDDKKNKADATMMNELYLSEITEQKLLLRATRGKS